MALGPDDIPERVARLCEDPRFQRKVDDDDLSIRVERLDDKSEQAQPAQPAQPCDDTYDEFDAKKNLDRNLAFLDLTLEKIRRDNLFDRVSSDKNFRLSDEDAKYHLQEFEVKNNLAVIIVSLDGIQYKDGDIRLKYGEMRQKM